MPTRPAEAMLASEVSWVLGIMPYPGGSGGDLLDVLGVLALLVGGGLAYGFVMVGVYRRTRAAHALPEARPQTIRKAA